MTLKERRAMKRIAVAREAIVRYEVGDKAIVTANYSGHGFGMGDMVVITARTSYDENSYKAKSLRTESEWSLSHREITKEGVEGYEEE